MFGQGNLLFAQGLPPSPQGLISERRATTRTISSSASWSAHSAPYSPTAHTSIPSSTTATTISRFPTTATQNPSSPRTRPLISLPGPWRRKKETTKRLMASTTPSRIDISRYAGPLARTRSEVAEAHDGAPAPYLRLRKGARRQVSGRGLVGSRSRVLWGVRWLRWFERHRVLIRGGL